MGCGSFCLRRYRRCGGGRLRDLSHSNPSNNVCIESKDESRRLVAYSDYLTAIAVYKNQSYYFVTGFGDGSLKTWEARSAVEKDLGPSFLDAQRKGEIVQLVCVEGVCPVVKSLLDASDDLNHLIYQMQNKANANDWSGIEKDLPDLYAKFTKMQDFETDLRVKAHDDLTSEPTR
jgi:hypothetical protein